MKKLLLIFMILFLSACDTLIDDTMDDDLLDDDPIVDDPIDDDPIDDDPIVEDPENVDQENCTHLDNIGDWIPVWCDEFEYEGLPLTTKWTYDIGGHGWGNNEKQFYTYANEDNVYVENGVLTMSANKEYFQSSDYTSARLVSVNDGNFTYGKIQIRAKLPGGRGVWPALWMLPTDLEYGGWPYSGEIDIMEYVGYDPTIVHGTIHTGAYNHMLGTQVGKSIVVDTAETEFHVYEMDWEPGYIELFVDGVSYAVFGYNPEDNIDIENSDAWPFDQEFHLIMNIAIGGNWGGAMGIDDSIFPQEMLIDYVRVYQKDYEGMDQEAPSEVTNLEFLDSSRSTIYATWDKAIDDVQIKEYEIYLGDVLYTTTTVNGYLISELNPNTNYSVGIVAVDFAGNKSEPVSGSYGTLESQSINERIEAENYNSMDGVQLENTQDTGGGQNAGWFDNGDHLEYVLKVEEAGTYRVNFRYASPDGNGAFDFYGNDNLLFNIALSVTGGWQSWSDVMSEEVYLEVGEYSFIIDVTEAGFNLNYFEFEKTD